MAPGTRAATALRAAIIAARRPIPTIPLKQSCGINPLQSVNDASKERHEHVDGRLNKTGQITGNSFKHTDEELEQGIYNLRSILDQRLKNTPRAALTPCLQ